MPAVPFAFVPLQMQPRSMNPDIRDVRTEPNRSVQVAQRLVELSQFTIVQGPLHQGGILSRIKTQRLVIHAFQFLLAQQPRSLERWERVDPIGPTSINLT